MTTGVVAANPSLADWHESASFRVSLYRSAIRELFSLGGPSPISWLVIAVIVDAIKRFSGRLLFYIGPEVRERMPSFANRDSSSSVPFKGCIIWIFASIYHRMPLPIQSTFGTSMAFIRPTSWSSASARNNRTSSKIGTPDFNVCSAIAPAFPTGRIDFCSWNFLYSSKESVAFSDNYGISSSFYHE